LYSASDWPFVFLCVISLNLQTYLCLCVVSGHTPSQHALQEWPVLSLSPSVAAVVLRVMFVKRLKFLKNGLQICWKPGSVSKGRRELRAEACKFYITLFIYSTGVQCLLTQDSQPSASSGESTCFN